MAIVQISRITHRRGPAEELPQLAGAELGWCTDTRQLFIGNGTVEDLAPVVGNTEILTEFSDIAQISNYLYKNSAVGYDAITGSSPSEPVIRSLQARLDDFVSVRAYGAVGNGIVDDTVAINRALLDLYCKPGNNTNPQVRRTLFFPAGIYRLTGTINIPSYASIVGEGSDSTIFRLSSGSSAQYVGRLADSIGEVGANMGLGVLPRDIRVSGVTFESEDPVDLFLVENALRCSFEYVTFRGPLSTSLLIPDQNQVPPYDPPDIAAVRFSSGNAACQQITFDSCLFTSITFGINTTSTVRSVTVTNSQFRRLFSGIVLDDFVSPATVGGFRAVGNTFDEIFSTGIHYGNISLNLTAHNIFYDVANGFTQQPVDPIILFGNDNNVSLIDMFERSDFDNRQVPRVKIGNGQSITSTQIKLGHLTQVSGKVEPLLDGQINRLLAEISTPEVRAFLIEYTLIRNDVVRHGAIRVVRSPTGPSGSLFFTDDYTENDDSEVDLTVTQEGSLAVFRYSTPISGGTGGDFITFSVRHLA